MGVKWALLSLAPFFLPACFAALVGHKKVCEANMGRISRENVGDIPINTPYSVIFENCTVGEIDAHTFDNYTMDNDYLFDNLLFRYFFEMGGGLGIKWDATMTGMRVTNLIFRFNEQLIFRRDSFHDILGLTQLIIVNSEVESLPEVLLHTLRDLTVLDLYGNRLTSISELHFRDLLSLEILNISKNQLKQIHWDAFDNNINIIEIVLNKNQLTDLPMDLLENQGRLNIIDLSDNQIKSLPYLFLNEPRNMTTLNFENNRIGRIFPCYFEHIDAVTSVSLGNNELAYVDDLLLHNVSIKYLNLESNQIEELPESFLNDQPEMVKLSLQSNKLKSLSPLTFKGAPYLQEVQLMDNRLTHLPVDVFHYLQVVQIITLDGNRFAKFCPNWFTALREKPEVVITMTKNPASKNLCFKEPAVRYRFKEVHGINETACLQLYRKVCFKDHQKNANNNRVIGVVIPCIFILLLIGYAGAYVLRKHTLEQGKLLNEIKNLKTERQNEKDAITRAEELKLAKLLGGRKYFKQLMKADSDGNLKDLNSEKNEDEKEKDDSVHSKIGKKSKAAPADQQSIFAVESNQEPGAAPVESNQEPGAAPAESKSNQEPGAAPADSKRNQKPGPAPVDIKVEQVPGAAPDDPVIIQKRTLYPATPPQTDRTHGLLTLKAKD